MSKIREYSKLNLFENYFLRKYHIAIPKIKKRENVIKFKNKFKDKVIIVTGASSGIGRACAFEFANNNAKIILASRRGEEIGRAHV